MLEELCRTMLLVELAVLVRNRRLFWKYALYATALHIHILSH